MDVNFGWPGKVHNVWVLVNSLFYVANATLFPNWTCLFIWVDIPLVILGDLRSLHYLTMADETILI